MRLPLILAAFLLAFPSLAREPALGDDRRFSLVLMQFVEGGVFQPIPIPNGTFTTQAGCDKAARQLIQALTVANPRAQFVFQCVDRGSAV